MSRTRPRGSAALTDGGAAPSRERRLAPADHPRVHPDRGLMAQRDRAASDDRSTSCDAGGSRRSLTESPMRLQRVARPTPGV